MLSALRNDFKNKPHASSHRDDLVVLLFELFVCFNIDNILYKTYLLFVVVSSVSVAAAVFVCAYTNGAIVAFIVH